MPFRPLPRSLDPLAGEALPGFVLRLSYRLKQSPGRIAVLTGLRPDAPGLPKAISIHSLLHLDAETAATFATATRLSPQEVAGLCLGGFRDRYPPVAGPLRRANGAARVNGLASWVLTGSTRFCPECLAGDGSPIQQALGGAWQKLWRLPVVFACSIHRRLLRHECPHCQQPVHSSRRKNDGLVPRHHDATLHPLQCRSAVGPPGRHWRAQPACGARLDQLRAAQPDRQPPTLEQLLAVQRKFLDLLQPPGPNATRSLGQATTVAEYFNDLRLLISLIRASWPAARPLTDLWGADAVDRHLERHHHQTQARRQQGLPPLGLHNRPPAAPDACASLLLIAEQLLALDNPATAGEHLNSLLTAPVSQQLHGWIWQFRRAEPHCTAGLRAAVAPLAQRLHPGRQPRNPGERRPPARRPRRPSQRRAVRPPPRACRFGREHIPQFLPADWFERHFRVLAGASALLRRFAPVKLVQMTAGGTLAAAAAYLGLPSNKLTSTRSRIWAWGRDDTNATSWDAALEALACELDATTGLIEFQHRREVMRAWSMPPEDWQALLDTTRQQHRGSTQWRQHERQLASALVWAQVTQGEARLAPIVLASQQPSGRRQSDLASALTRVSYELRSPGVFGRRWLALSKALDAYADQLATRIDTGWQPSSRERK